MASNARYSIVLVNPLLLGSSEALGAVKARHETCGSSRSASEVPSDATSLPVVSNMVLRPFYTVEEG